MVKKIPKSSSALDIGRTVVLGAHGDGQVQSGAVVLVGRLDGSAEVQQYANGVEAERLGGEVERRPLEPTPGPGLQVGPVGDERLDELRLARL
jgi:hypothetical protein